MLSSIKHHIVALSIALLGFGIFCWSASPTAAATLGVAASCSVVSTISQKCSIPILETTLTVTIQYATMECSSTGATAYSLREFDVAAIPPNGTAAVTYYVSGNRGSLGGVVNTGAIVAIHVKVDTASTAYIYFATAPAGTTTCTVSLSGTY